jgi:hypothetical protein
MIANRGVDSKTQCSTLVVQEMGSVRVAVWLMLAWLQWSAGRGSIRSAADHHEEEGAQRAG